MSDPLSDFGEFMDEIGKVKVAPRYCDPPDVPEPETKAVETQATVGAWARETFPGGTDRNPRTAQRMLEEVVELCYAAGMHRVEMIQTVRDVCRKFPEAGLTRCPEPDDVGPEAGDVLVTLYALADRWKVDLHEHCDRKMGINRARTWHANGDGTGYHVKDADVPRDIASTY